MCRGEQARKTRRDRQPAAGLPVARVCVDVPLPHLDRPFDYLVPAELDAAAQPGVRVKVRFAGQLVDGWLLERVAESEHRASSPAWRRSSRPSRCSTRRSRALARAVADRYAGSLADVLRLAVPPRQAGVEQAAQTPPCRRAECGGGSGRHADGADPRASRAGVRRGGRGAGAGVPVGGTRRARRSCGRWRGRRRGRCGRRCRARTGRPGSPRRRRHRSRAGGARWSWWPTPATWTGSTRR